MDQYAGSPGHSTYSYTELVVLTAHTHGRMTRHPSSTSSITAHHLLDSVVQGKIAEAVAPTICLGATPSGLSFPQPPSSPILLCRMPFLQQPSQFILAWDRHRIMLACIPSGTYNVVNTKDTVVVHIVKIPTHSIFGGDEQSHKSPPPQTMGDAFTPRPH